MTLEEIKDDVASRLSDLTCLDSIGVLETDNTAVAIQFWAVIGQEDRHGIAVIPPRGGPIQLEKEIRAWVMEKQTT